MIEDSVCLVPATFAETNAVSASFAEVSANFAYTKEVEPECGRYQ
jgi:hypothetical protein